MYRSQGPCFAVLVLSTVLSSPAQAEQAITKVALHGTAMTTRHEGAPLHVAYLQDEPDMLQDADVRLSEDGLTLGGGLSASLMIDGTRIGLGITLFGLQDTSIVHSQLPDGYELQGGTIWGETVDVRLGREFRLGPLFPYLDLRLAFTIIAVNTGLRNDAQGHLGTTTYNRMSVGLGPVVGFCLPLSDALYADLSGYAGVIGDEKFGGTLGLGAWFEL
jgi:hypothetical protein